MSNPSPFGAGRRQTLFPTMPRGEVVATYDTYNQAQEAVDVLAKADFPVKQLSILGNDLKTVERVTGKLSWGRVAVAGAASGAWLGVFFGLLFFIFSPDGAGMPFVIAAVLLGAGFGMLFGLVSYAVNRRRRDFTSTMQVIATNYQVIVDASLVHRARNVLGGEGATEAAAASAPTADARAEAPGTPGQAREAAEAREAQEIHEAHQAEEAEQAQADDAQAAQKTREFRLPQGQGDTHEDPTPPDVPAGTARPAEPQAPPAYGERTRDQ